MIHQEWNDESRTTTTYTIWHQIKLTYDKTTRSPLSANNGKYFTWKLKKHVSAPFLLNHFNKSSYLQMLNSSETYAIHRKSTVSLFYSTITACDSSLRWWRMTLNSWQRFLPRSLEINHILTPFPLPFN